MTKKKKAVFLDRDGVLNKAYGHRPPNDASELVVFSGVPEAIRIFNETGFLVFVVTNQGGVGLGYMTPADLDNIHRKLEEEVQVGGGQFTEIMACMHKPRAGCSCRKPKPGMLLSLANKYDLDLKASYLVGDRDMDIAAGRAAGTTTILIESKEKTKEKADHKCPHLLAASKLVRQLEMARFLENGVEG